MKCKLLDNSSSNESSGIYTGDLNICRQPSERIFNEVSSNDQWKYRSPYWKVTDPKTKKSSRSVPGVPTYKTPSLRLKSEQRRFSPPLKSDYLFQNSTILEVSGNYENYPSNSTQNEKINERDFKRFKVFY